MKRHWEWTLDAPRDALWRYLADTDWVNRHAGLPAISARTEALPDGGARRFAGFHAGPVFVEWEERPTIWRAPEFYEVERRYRTGPLARFVNRTTLTALDEHRTRVEMDVELEARSVALNPLLALVAFQGKRGASKAIALAAKLALGDSATIARPESNRFSVVRERGAAPEAVDALERLFAGDDDRELAQMRPYEIADRYGVPRKAMLRAFLIATRAGLFNLKWAVICPSCRGTPNAFASLSELRTDLHCPTCNVSYGPQFDRSVEVTFDARPLGRGGDVPLFCIASPQKSAHVVAQAPLGPRDAMSFDLQLDAGSYDLNAVGIGLAPFVATEEASVRRAWASIAPAEVSIPPEIAAGAVEIRIDSETDRETIVRIERGRWPDTIATAAHVTAMQEFRDMFSSEVLAPGLELGIESLAVLFTDLVESTAMYSRAGDAPAFKIVTDHFDRMRAVIDANDGAIVKTIGDAVMAVFVDPAACLRASLQLDAAVRDLHHDGRPLRVRVGFHVGPCIAMRANDRMDYFGTTVNLAARLQSKASAGEVTFATEVAAKPEIQRELGCETRRLGHESLDLKGFAQPVSIVRVSAN